MISSAYLQIVMMARGSWLVGLVISISMRYDFISTRYAAIYPSPAPPP
jgi:hypothetical protein